MTLVDFLGNSLSIDAIRAIVQILALVSSFTSIVVTQIFARKALTRWRKELGITQLFLWLSIVLCLVELFQPVSFSVNGIVIKNFGTKFGTTVWIFGLINLMKIFSKIANLETIQFNKPQLELNLSEEGFDIPCIDEVLVQAKKEKEITKLFYPILLAGDENCRPWEVAQKFVVHGLNNGCGVIYFTFTRPASYICDQLKNKGLEKNYNNLVIIDCYSPLTMKERSKKLLLTVVVADPRNPHFLNRAYEDALKLLCGYRLRDKIILKSIYVMAFVEKFFTKGDYYSSRFFSQRQGCNKIRVVYDALSDFLFFTDIEIASQYLRHNMVWEEKNNVESLYIFRVGTIEKHLEEYIFWFANTVINLEAKENKILMTIRGLFRKPKTYDIDFDFNFVKKKKHE